MRRILASLFIVTSLALSQTLPVAPSQITGVGAVAGDSIVFGTLYWGPNVAGILCTVTSQTTVACAHNLNSTNVRSWVWDASGYLVRPALKVNALNTVTITFDSAFTGIIVVK